MDPIDFDLPPALRELGPGDAPFPGTLRAGDPPTVWVDAAGFAASPAWRAGAAEHVLRPLDVAHGAEGLQVLLPHTPVRLEAVLDPSALSPGAAVTLAVSALRGAAEADRLAAPHGRWWVTSEGRPVLALTGSDEWRGDTVAMLREVGDRVGVELADIVRRAAAEIEDPRLLAREAEGAEHELFGAAAAEPLPTTTATDAAPPAISADRSGARRASQDEGRGILHDAVARLIDAGAADRVFANVAAVVRRMPRSVRRAPRPTPAARTGRKRVWVTATAAAAVVAVVGVSWPTPDDASAGAPTERPSATAATDDDAAETPAADEPRAATPTPATLTDVGAPELVTAARSLLDESARCEDSCDESWENPASARRVDAAIGDFRIEIVDEYGGVAAVRVTGGDRTQVVVIVETEKQWLIRDVYDIGAGG